jgi:hypothetical protein
MTVADTRGGNALAGPKILLQGDSGSGKTYSLGTLVDWAAAQTPPREVFCLFTENGLEALLGYWNDPPAGKSVRAVPPNLRWHVVPSPAIDLKSLTEAAFKVGLLSYKALSESVDPNRALNNPYEKILKVLADFPDDRTGETFGNIGVWNSSRILAIDSLSELANACMKMVIGNKPTAALPDYGVAQNNLLNLLRFFTQGFQPTLVMTAHLQKQVNELTGGMVLTTKAIGKAMADDIPQLFSEVLYARKEGAEWVWDTAAMGVVTKTRYLPIASKIPANFGTIMDKWLKRAAV